MTHQERQKSTKKDNSKERSFLQKHSLLSWIMILGIAITVIAVTFIVSSQSKQNIKQNNEIPAIRALGPESARVTIVEYGDFGCINCKVWHQLGIVKKIQEKYGDKVRFVWHDFPVITSNSPKAAEAGFCANDQGKFWKFHDVVYENFPMLSINDLKKYAIQVGLDSNVFNQCLDTGKHYGDVQQELNESYSHGFRATPSFLVNGKALIGPPTFEQLTKIVDEALLANN